MDVRTQWRVGVNGATGLDYGAVLATLRVAHRLRGDELRDVFECIRAAEVATLRVWAEARSGAPGTG